MTKRLSWWVLAVSLVGLLVLGARWRARQAPADTQGWAGSGRAEAGSVHVVADAPLVAGRAATAAVVPVARFPARRVAGVPAVAASSPARPAQPDGDRHSVIAPAYCKLPLHFERNEGQTDRRVRYLARGNGYGLFLTADEAVLTLRHARPRTEPDHRTTSGPERDSETGAAEPAAVVRTRLVGARPDAQVVGEEPLPGKSNYFLGRDPSRWRTDVPLFGRVTYRAVWPGIDLTYYGNQRQLEYDFVVAPGADPGVIRLAYDGVDGMSLDDAGNLVLRTGNGELVQRAPVVYQRVGSERRGLEGRFILAADARVGFEVGPFDRSLPLVIDPVLVYSTYLGGISDEDYPYGIAVDGAGTAYVTGWTRSTDFPTQNPYQTDQGGGDVFVTKLAPSGSALVYSTYLGGSSNDEGSGIAVDGAGSAYVTGQTTSTDFPTQGPYQTYQGGGDVFVTKLAPSGSALVYSTYLGGSSSDGGTGIAVDGAESAYVTGYTSSTNFPTQGPYQTDQGVGDAFVTKLAPSGSALVYSTYLGGSADDSGTGIALDAAGNAYVTGVTRSTDFPTQGPYQTYQGGPYDAFVTKLAPSGSAPVYSTYLGGGGDEYGYGIAVDGAGSAYVTGYTYSTDFPTQGPYQTDQGGSDVFVTKLSATGAALVYSTYLGGGGDDWGFSIAVNGAGSAYVTGSTSSTDFPTQNPYQTDQQGDDAFVTKLAASGSSLMYSTYLGGNSALSNAHDFGRHIVVDGAGSAYVTGSTTSTDFPTQVPYQTYQGGTDAFVTKLVDAEADVSITKTDGATTAVPGTPLTYTIVASNAGPSNAPTVTVADIFPGTCPGASWICAGAGGGTCAASGSGNINDSANLPSGGSVTYTATCTISASATGTLVNTATATIGGGNVGDPAPGNNSATDTDTLTAQADLSVTLIDAPDPVAGLGTLFYIITVANAGPSLASAVSADHTLPASVTFVSATGSGWSCSAGTGTVTCTRPSLAPGATATFFVQVTVGPANATLNSSVTVTATASDPNAANNSASAQTTVNGVPSADLSVALTDGGVAVLWGRPLTYSLTVTNGGPDAVTAATVSDSFPAGLAAVSWTCTASAGSSCAATGSGNINDTAVALLPAGTATYFATGIVAYGTASPLVNTATISSSTYDPVAANNSSTISTPVDVDLIFRDGFEGSP